MIRRHRGEEEGQIIPALLLTVVAILFLGLVFVQVGSAAEQKTQTQTATDSAAVASTHQVRDFAITTGAHLVITEWAFGVVFAAVPQVVPQVQAASCDAVQRNWNANPHKGAQIDCGGSLVAFATGDGVQVNLTAPPGQVVDGPAEADNERAKASARPDGPMATAWASSPIEMARAMANSPLERVKVCALGTGKASMAQARWPHGFEQAPDAGLATPDPLATDFGHAVSGEQVDHVVPHLAILVVAIG
jgi:hypothetical protein